MARSKTATASNTTEGMTLAKLRDSQSTLFVRNNGDTVIVCNVGTLSFYLAQKGAPDSVQVLPKEVAANPSFQRLWLKKQVTVSDDPEMENEIILLTRGQNEMEAERQRGLTDMVESSPISNSLVEKKCLISDERVFQTMEDVRNGVPPLAPRFADLAHTFIPTQVSGPNGPEFTFAKVS